MAQRATSKRKGATAVKKAPARKVTAAKKPAAKAKKAAAAKPAAKAKKAAPAKKAPARKAPPKKAAPAAKRSAAKKPAAKGAAKLAAKAPARAAAKKAPAKTAPRKKAAAKAPAAPPARVHVERHQPETLRLRGITPGLTVGDLERSLAFYVEGLGFTVKERWEREGVLQGVMLLAGDCELALGADDWAKGRDRVKGVGFRLYLDTIQDVDALAARAQAHGIAVDGPHDSSWGARLIGVTDPDGFNLTFQRYTNR